MALSAIAAKTVIPIAVLLLDCGCNSLLKCNLWIAVKFTSSVNV